MDKADGFGVTLMVTCLYATLSTNRCLELGEDSRRRT